jgi:hypothetical protein
VNGGVVGGVIGDVSHLFHDTQTSIVSEHLREVAVVYMVRTSIQSEEAAVHQAHTTRSRGQPARITTIVSLMLLLVAAIYGLMSISYPVSLMQGKLSLSTQLIINAVSEPFVLGDAPTTAKAIANYTRAFFGISLHSALGGLALLLCTVQFVPAIRRAAPAVHRAVGKIAVLAICLSMIGAIIFLSKTPAGDVFSGEPFAAALWTLAVSTLMTLSLAIKAIRERQIRAHMGWMALLFAGLLTAPLLRIGYTVFGNLMPGSTLAQVNAGIAGLMMPVAIWLMTWWMQRIGQSDMSLLQPHPTLHWPAIRVMGWMGAATALHEGLLAPMGMDLIGHWRHEPERLPMIAALWAVPMAWLLPRIHRDLQSAIKGQAISLGTLASGAAASLGALLIAVQLPSHDFNEFGRLFYWAGSALMGLCLVCAGLIWRQAKAVHTPARVLSLLSWLMPAMWAPVMGALSLTGWSASASLTATLTICAGYFMWNGFASAFGLPMPGVPAAAPQTSESAA